MDKRKKYRLIKKSIIYLVVHFLICLGIFLCIQKIVFFFYNWQHGGSLCSFTDIINSYINGFALDVATAAYLTVVPFLLIGVHIAIPRFNPYMTLKIYSGFIAVLLSVITMVDAALYEFWEFKLDATVFFYLKEPKHVFANVSISYIFLHLFVIICFAYIYFKLLCFSLNKSFFTIVPKRQLPFIWGTWILLGASLFGLIRGLRIWPNTPGRAFYSATAFHNHLALNPLFNIVYTYFRSEDFSRQFRFFPEEERYRIYSPLFPNKGNTTHCLLKNQRPNILFVILEGFGAVFVEKLGGIKNVGIQINEILSESVNFKQCYCSSFRTDRGIVSALSGYLGQPTTSIMRYSLKINSLPGLPKTLKTYGYSTQVLYPSDITFFNMSDYFIAAGHDKLVSQDHFPISERTCKWGVPDHIAFEWLYQDIQQKHLSGEGPWYTTYLTISSHTPFDVPYTRLPDEKLNAFAYTDSCFSAFINKLKVTPAWDNLLIICSADHGFNHQEIASPNFPHIPLFLLGGAINNPCEIETILSQTDIPATILGQLGIPHEDFIFSRDVLADTYTYPFAFNTFNNGFNYRDSTGCTVYDNTANQALWGHDSIREKKGKAILQTLYDDLNKR